MLKKADRMTAKEIESLSSGKSVFGTLISMRYAPSEKTKFSVSVSKKVAPRAVDRNRMRRRIFAVLEKGPSVSGRDYFVMIMPKKECLTASFDSLSDEVRSLFGRIKA